MTRITATDFAIALLLLAIFNATAAIADDVRDFCPDRPGLNTTVCVLQRGQVAIETSFVDWSVSNDSSERTENLGLGATLLRYGLTDTLEIRAAFDGYAITRSRDELGARHRAQGAGDSSFSVRQNLRNPDGSDFAMSAMFYISLPTGSRDQSAGDWGAGVLLPLGVELAKGISLSVTPEINAAVDSDGDGRHLSYGSAIGLGFSLTDTISMSLETYLVRDRDPESPSTEALAGIAFAWKASDDLQFDAGLVRGLNHDSADWELYTGIAKRF